jgi:hypothetical protein
MTSGALFRQRFESRIECGRDGAHIVVVQDQLRRLAVFLLVVLAT